MVLCLVFSQKVIYEAEITPYYIKVIYGTYHGIVIATYPIDDVKHFSQGVGKNCIFINLELKNGKKKLLLLFSSYKRRKKFQAILNRLSEITGLQTY